MNKQVFINYNQNVFVKAVLNINIQQKGQSNLSDRKEKKMSRTNTNKRVDKRVFKRTAATTKKMNISPKVMRGGIRL